MLLLQPACFISGILVMQLRRFSVFRLQECFRVAMNFLKYLNFKTLKHPESNYSMRTLLETVT
jgi:hypothetical protein